MNRICIALSCVAYHQEKNVSLFPTSNKKTFSNAAKTAVTTALMGIVCAISPPVLAAEVDKSELARMSAEARKKGVTHVMVHLAPVSLSEISTGLDAVKARMAAKAAKLVAELGSEARAAGYWDGGVGQIGLNVTEAGLKILQSSGNAIRFYPGKSLQARSQLAGFDGRFEVIESQLAAQGFANVQVALNVEGLQFDIAKNGAMKFTAPGASMEAAANSARSLFGRMSSQHAAGKEAALLQYEALVGRYTGLQNAAISPEFTLRVTQEGLEMLATSKEVRSIKPVGFIDRRQFKFDDEAIAFAEKHGKAEVIISVRLPMAGGQLSKLSFDANTESNKRVIDAVLADAGVRSPMNEIAVFGATSGFLTAVELKALKASDDPRLLNVVLNKPVAKAQLATSTVSTNFIAAWNATNVPGGYRGAGQNVIVMDTGVQSGNGIGAQTANGLLQLPGHVFLRNAAGNSKITYEACFGSNATEGGVNYKSICPQANADGDSPLGFAGSAAPRLNCAADDPGDSCDHGTHVAGIAAGRNAAGVPTGYQGVANEANIVAVQVFSFDTVNNTAGPLAFNADLLKAMQTVASLMQLGTTTNPFTVNLSLGAGAWQQPCSGFYPEYSTAVQTLFSLGVPVVAATGNSNRSPFGIAFPACVSRVIKVGALKNVATGSTITDYTQLALPANFAGDFFWMAPGGDIATPAQGGGFIPGSFIASSGNGGNVNSNGLGAKFILRRGTSMAAPHVSGLYAMYKSADPTATVDTISNWILNNASLQMAGICIGSPNCAFTNFRRIRLPNFF